ncbi:MAG: VOC family protein [Candidatus Kapaibacterium sp.]
MKRVTGIGGIFFKSDDPEKLRSWYQQHLGLDADEFGAVFEWRYPDNPMKAGSTVWNPFPATTEYFNPSTQPFMINYRVENLEWLLEQLQKEGVAWDGRIEDHEYGRFAWVMDPEGNRLELWEPPFGT